MLSYNKAPALRIRPQTIGAVEGLGTSATAPSEALARPSWGSRVPGGRPPHRLSPAPVRRILLVGRPSDSPLRVRLSVFFLSPAPKPRPHSFRRPLPSPARVLARRAAAMLMRTAASGAGKHSQRQNLYIQSQRGRSCEPAGRGGRERRPPVHRLPEHPLPASV